MGGTNANLTNRQGFANIIGSTGNWQNAYGGSISFFLRPFTTATGDQDLNVPRIEAWISRDQGSLANSSGLNPYGDSTTYQGIVSGPENEMPLNLDEFIDPYTVRSYGFKYPYIIVGAGFDKFGQPVPNSNTSWNTQTVLSGSFGSGQVPAQTWLGSGDVAVSRAADSNRQKFKAGPLDLRWDYDTKTWKSPQSVYAATVATVALTGGGNTADPQFAEAVRYDVEIYDGEANRIRITGVTHRGPKPTTNTHKILPLASGDSCLMIHYPDPLNPNIGKLGMWVTEVPASEECSTSEDQAQLLEDPLYYQSAYGDPLVSSGILVGSGLGAGLLNNPLSVSRGGVGLNSIGSGHFLVGNASGGFYKHTLSVGSGLGLTHNYNNPTGNIVIAITGVDFTFASGVNTTITALSGLNTPLDISMGGTSATGKVWLDLQSDQAANGLKTFQYIKLTSTGWKLPSGGRYPQLELGSTGVGLYWNTTHNYIGFMGSGQYDWLKVSNTGHEFRRPIIINDTGKSRGYDVTPLKVYESYPDDSVDSSGFGWRGNYLLAEFLQYDGTVIATLNASGILTSRYFVASQNEIAFGDESNRINLVASPTGVLTLNIPTTGGTLAVNNTYTTGELETGRVWINGSGVYERVVQLNSGWLNVDGQFLAHNISNLDKIIRSEAQIYNGTIYKGIPYSSGNNYLDYKLNSSGIISMVSGSVFTSGHTGFSGHIILEYTKSG